MKHTAKKILCTLLVMVMCLTVAPLSGFVDFGITASALADSGSCGENVTYTYDSSTGELVISGTGAMTNYIGSCNGSGSPFFNSDIKSVVIEDGVTSIGNWAFEFCTSLENVTIPDSVTSIGGYGTFDGCRSLESITIGNSVTYIGNLVFGGCTSLKSVTIPDSVTSIEDGAFVGCTSLESVTIPDSVASIGIEAFYCCESLQAVYFGGTEKKWDEITSGNNDESLNNATIFFKDGVRCKKHTDEDHDGYCDICKEMTPERANCSCNCHKSGFMGFIWKIILFFNKLFKTKKTCACGIAHY